MARSEELIKKIYNAVQEVYDNQVSLEVQKRKIQKEMNPGAFSDFYYGYVKLRTGEICKRGLETRSYDYFISKIYEEYGKAGLEKAVVFWVPTAHFHEYTSSQEQVSPVTRLFSQSSQYSNFLPKRL